MRPSDFRVSYTSTTASSVAAVPLWKYGGCRCSARSGVVRYIFVALRALDDATVTGPRLLSTLSRDLADLGPLVDYLCAALELEF